jgi:hypothetical protein
MYPTAKWPITFSWSGVFESAASVEDATTGVGADGDVAAALVAVTVDGGLVGAGGSGELTVAEPLAVPSCAYALCAAQRTKPNAAILNPKRAMTHSSLSVAASTQSLAR